MILVLIPILAAIIIFFIGLWIFSILFPDFSIFISAVFASLLYFGTIQRIKYLNLKRDSAKTDSYYLDVAHAYFLIAETLKTFSWNGRKWVLVESDQTKFSMTAISEWRDQSFKDMKLFGPDSVLVRQVVLDVKVRPNVVPEMTDVELSWQVNSPLHRDECNALQDRTREAIEGILSKNQTRQPKSPTKIP